MRPSSNLKAEQLFISLPFRSTTPGTLSVLPAYQPPSPTSCSASSAGPSLLLCIQRWSQPPTTYDVVIDLMANLVKGIEPSDLSSDLIVNMVVFILYLAAKSNIYSALEAIT